MAELKEARVPDIGGYDDVPVIEVLVAVGDTVKVDQGLVTLESDKATMEVPSSAAGTVVELKVKVGDKVSEGSLLLLLEAGDGARPVEASDDRGVLVAEGVAASKVPPELMQPQAAGATPAPAPSAGAAGPAT